MLRRRHSRFFLHAGNGALTIEYAHTGQKQVIGCKNTYDLLYFRGFGNGKRSQSTRDGKEPVDCREKALSDDYSELIFDFTDPAATEEENEQYCITKIMDKFSIAYASRQEIADILGQLYLYRNLPHAYGLMVEDFDPISLINSGILQTQRPPLSLTGSGVILAFIDTGERVILMSG